MCIRDRFYVDGLGWEPALDVPGEVLMIKAGEHLVLSLWSESGFEAEVGTIRRGVGVVPMTLAHNVSSREEVDEVLPRSTLVGSSRIARHGPIPSAARDITRTAAGGTGQRRIRRGSVPSITRT